LENLRQLELEIKLPVYPISAMHRTGIESLLIHLRYMYDKYGDKKDIEEGNSSCFSKIVFDLTRDGHL
jgi:Fe2+ transport system protein B